MKKITLLCLLVLSFVYTNEVIAQTLNQNAGWPNAAWTVTGTFDAANPDVFEGDPTVDVNFAYDDDDQGNVAGMNDNDIVAESPVIDLTAASGAGETWLTISGDYVYNYLEDDVLKFQYWDADASAWTDWGFGFTADTAGAPTNDYCSAIAESYTTSILNIVGFTATQLSGFKYRISYDDNPAGSDWNYGFCFQAPTITSETPPSCPDPLSLVATPIAFDTANISWNEIGTASVWDIELVDITAAGVPTGNPTSIGVSNPTMLSGLTASNDYEVYVRADCDASGGTGVSNWVGPVAFTTPVACDVINGAPLIDALTDISIDFSWTAPVTGTPVGYNWEIVEDGTGQGGTILASGSTAGTTASSGDVLTLNTTYNVFVQTDCGVAEGTSVWAGPYSFTTQPAPEPANNDCDGAESVTQETNIADVASATAIPGSLAGATASGLPAEVCNGFTGIANDDVWYSFVALTSNVNVTFDAPNTDTVAVLYSGTCGALSVVGCDDSGNPEAISATGLVVGDTYYTRVFQYGTSTTLGDDFTVSIWSPDTLGTEEFENENAFTYFPNPVKNELTLNAQKDIQNVAVYNMLGQEVLRTAPNATDSIINMNELSQGAYFVQVTIGNIVETVRIIKQ
nr:T9SS type A sorting domain-containing protein [uncultured Psychroserpens sp.]